MVATPRPNAAAEGAAVLRRRIAELNRRLEAERHRSGDDPDEVAAIDRMRSHIASQHVRLERLEHEAAAVLAEIARLEDEVHGREKALALLLGTVLNRIERITADAWSPVPVLGYRLWAMRNGGVHGARIQWRSPDMTAVCEGFAGEAPHSDGTCGRLGCGVYATKSLEALLNLHVSSESHSYVAGLVGLSGRVVEHEHGYRAGSARVQAVFAVWPDRTMATSDEIRVAALFAGCDRIPIAWCDLHPAGSDPSNDMTRYLAERTEKEAAWI